MPAVTFALPEASTPSRMFVGPVAPSSAAQLGDAELMVRMQADDASAFEVLFERYRRRAHRVAGATSSGAGSSDDIVQDAFLGVWRGRATYRPELGSVGSWVLGIVRLRSIDAHRREARHTTRRASAEGACDRVSDALDFEVSAGERERAAALRTELGKLPDAQRDVVVLAYFGELSVPEIAARLSLPLGTVKGRMRLGLDKLRAA